MILFQAHWRSIPSFMKKQMANSWINAVPGKAFQLARRTQLLIHVMCICALALTAFAHKAPASAEIVLAQPTAYALPDGSLPILCLTVEDGEGTSHPASHKYQPCEFCRIAGSVALSLPPVIAGFQHRPDQSKSPVMPVSAILVADGFQPAAPPQGPPFFRKTA